MSLLRSGSNSVGRSRQNGLEAGKLIPRRHGSKSLLYLIVVLAVSTQNFVVTTAFLNKQELRHSPLCTRMTTVPSPLFLSSSYPTRRDSSRPDNQKESPWFVVNDQWNREDAQALLERDEFLPSNAYGRRKTLGRDAAEKECGGGTKESVGVMLVDDPRLVMTYAEFPLTSLDLLLDAAVQFLSSTSNDITDPIHMVDIGSGLGRIILYSAMTRSGGNPKHSEDDNKNWNVCGIEIASMLHEKALELVQTGVRNDFFGESKTGASPNDNNLSFHLGSATDESGLNLLRNADLVFSYSTAFKAKEFDPQVGALLLDTEDWSKPLSRTCKPGCVAVTTDRALDPRFGWKVVKRMDVPNPEVFGTTGFIHVLEDPPEEEFYQ